VDLTEGVKVTTKYMRERGAFDYQAPRPTEALGREADELARRWARGEIEPGASEASGG
jgi:hypothetical protein